MRRRCVNSRILTSHSSASAVHVTPKLQLDMLILIDVRSTSTRQTEWWVRQTVGSAHWWFEPNQTGLILTDLQIGFTNCQTVSSSSSTRSNIASTLAPTWGQSQCWSNSLSCLWAALLVQIDYNLDEFQWKRWWNFKNNFY